MPQIPNTRPTGITQRISSAPRFGGNNASARALQGLGQTVENIGTKLIQERNNLQAKNFARSTHLRVQRERQAEVNRLRQNLDPTDGTIQDGTKRTMSQAMTEWEETKRAEIRELAPNATAYEAFDNVDNSSMRRNILQTDQFQHEQMIQARVGMDNEFIEGKVKEIVGYRGDDVASKAKEALQDSVEIIAEGTGSVYSTAGAQERAIQASNTIAITALQNMYDQGKIAEGLAELSNYTDKTPEAKEMLQREINELSSSALPEGASEAVEGKDGYKRTTVDGETMVFDLEQAAWIPEEEWSGPTKVEGRRLGENLTPEQSIRMTRQFTRKMKEVQRKTQRKILGEVEDVMASLESNIPGSSIDLDTNQGKHILSKVLGKVRANFPKEEQREIMTDIFSSVVGKEINEEMALGSEMEAIQAISEIPKNVLTKLSKEGVLPKNMQGPLLDKEIIIAQNKARARFNQMREERNKDSAGFFIRNSRSFAKKASEKYESPENWKEYKAELRALQDRTGVAHANRKLLSNEDLAREAEVFDEMLSKGGTQESLDLAVNHISSMRERWGSDYATIVEQLAPNAVDKSAIMAASLPPTGDGTRTQRRILENSMNYELNKDRLSPGTAKRIKDTVMANMDPLYSAVQNSNLDPKSIASASQGLDKIITEELTAKFVNKNPTDDDIEEAAEETVQNFIKENWVKLDSHSEVLIPRTKLRELNTTPEVLEEAIDRVSSPTTKRNIFREKNPYMDNIDWDRVINFTGMAGMFEGDTPEQKQEKIDMLLVDGALNNIVAVPSEEGVSLFLEYMGRKVSLPRKGQDKEDGSPLFVPYKELLQEAQSAEEADKARERKRRERLGIDLGAIR